MEAAFLRSLDWKQSGGKIAVERAIEIGYVDGN